MIKFKILIVSFVFVVLAGCCRSTVNLKGERLQRARATGASETVTYWNCGPIGLINRSKYGVNDGKNSN